MIFLDNASTTKCLDEAAEVVKDALINNYFNPSAKYAEALGVYKKLEEQRAVLLDILGADKKEYGVVFTGSATEANNLVLNSSLSKHKENLISIGEHSSIYEAAKHFSQEGRKVNFVNLNKLGELDTSDLEKKLTKDTAFLSFMLVSNETGAITNAEEVVKLAKKISPKILVHIDMVQAFTKIDINLKKLGADYITISSHKIHGPKGVGALIYKKSVKLEPEIFGGGQENGKRSGTENLPSIMGFVQAACIMRKTTKENFAIIKEFKLTLSGEMEKLAKTNNLEMVINGDINTSSPYILSVSFPGLKGEVILHSLEGSGILVGTGSACNSAHSGNRVLEAMGKTKAEIEGNIRLSFSVDAICGVSPTKLAEKIINTVKSIKR